VTWNGKVRRDPEFPVHENRDRIAVDGKPVEQPQKIYLMMNKPRGVVTTASDERGRKTVYNLLGADSQNTASDQSWVAPVGRLDKASEGLLLLTNNSEWGARIAAPETHLDKTYHVQITGVVDPDFLNGLVDGVRSKEGQILRAKHARLLRTGEKNCWVELVLDEGRNRQIRRMMEALGVEVMRLVRVAIGPLQLGSLAKGEHRSLSPDEVQLLSSFARPDPFDSPSFLGLAQGRLRGRLSLRGHIRKKKP
jgi:23S rRNA pseudouridine2605 synthase